MISQKVLSFLKKNKITYQVVHHKQVFTAFDLSNTLKEKLNKIAKTLVVRADKKYVLVVLPAHLRVDFNKLKKALKAKAVEMAPEETMAKIFKIKPGAITPFGGLHKVETYLDKALFKAKEVLVGAGSFTDSLRLQTKDLAKLEKVTLADLGSAAKKAVKKVTKKVLKKVAAKL